MDCNGVKEHLVDFLYEELPPDLRAAFTEHLRGCAACKAEVAGFGHTLDNARAALSGPLATEPPARVRGAVVEAARAVAAKTAAARARRQEQEAEPGFFAKLLRTPWLLPAFGAASVATVVFLVRVLKNPEVIPGQRAESIEERAVPAAQKPAVAPVKEVPSAAPKPHGEFEQATPPAPTEKTGARGGKAVEAKSEAPMVRKRKAIADDSLAGLRLEGSAQDENRAASQEPSREKKRDGSGLDRRGSAGLGAGSASRFAEPPPPRRTPSRAADGFQPGMKQESSRPRGAAKDEAQSNVAAKKASRDVDVLLGDFDRPRSLPAPATQVAAPKALAAAPSHAAPTAAAAPPPPAPSAVAAQTEAPMRTAPAASNRSAESERPPRSWVPPPVAASAPRPSVQARPARATKPAGVDEAAEAQPAQAQPEAEHVADAKLAKGRPGPSLDESIRKADRLFAAQDWSAAAEAYRDLLRRFPGHKDAGKWRGRMDQSLIAGRERSQPGAKAAKARAADVAPAAAEKQ
jgi:hypothetical protein